MKRVMFIALAAVAMLLQGCQSVQSLQFEEVPAAQRLTVTGKPYDELWAAASKAVEEQHELQAVSQDKGAGTIYAEKPLNNPLKAALLNEFGYNVAVWIKPAPGADAYTIAVQSMPKGGNPIVPRSFGADIMASIKQQLGLQAVK